jgi:hypothetical protein
LWSVHVDVYPGDRAASCRALMRPVGVLYERGEFIVVHECTDCAALRRNRASPHDDLARMW